MVSRSRLVVHPAEQPLVGSVPVPSDADIGQRALLLAALANGTSTVRGAHFPDSLQHAAQALRTLGVSANEEAPSEWVVEGRGLNPLAASAKVADCRACRSLAAGLLGTLAGLQAGGAVRIDSDWVDGAEALVAGLKERGAEVSLESDSEGLILRAPNVALDTRKRLPAVQLAIQTSGEFVKPALLMSGLFAAGPTVVSEAIVVRDHTERLLDALDMPLETVGPLLSLHPPADPGAIRAFELDVPGDPGHAAVLLAAAQLVRGSHITVRRTSLNPTRTGIIDVIRWLGGKVGISPQGTALNEPFGEISAYGQALKATSLGAELAMRLGSDLYPTAVISAAAEGTTVLADLPLEQLERDVPRLVELLRAFGISAVSSAGGLRIEGAPERRLAAAHIVSRGSPELAISAVLLGLRGNAPTIVDDADCIGSSFPRFVGTLKALGARIEVTQ